MSTYCYRRYSRATSFLSVVPLYLSLYVCISFLFLVLSYRKFLIVLLTLYLFLPVSVADPDPPVKKHQVRSRSSRKTTRIPIRPKIIWLFRPGPTFAQMRIWKRPLFESRILVRIRPFCKEGLGPDKKNIRIRILNNTPSMHATYLHFHSYL